MKPGPTGTRGPWRKSRGFRALLLVVKWALVAMVLWFVGRALVESIAAVDWRQVSLGPAWLLASVPPVLLATAVGASAVRLAYRSFGIDLGMRQAAYLFAVPQLGKYVPGKVMAAAGHVGIARSYGVPLSLGGSIVLFLTGLGVASAMLLGLAAMSLQTLLGARVPTAHYVALVAVFVPLAVALHPRIYFALINLLLRALRRPPVPTAIGLRTIAGIVGLFVGQMLLYSLGFALMSRGLLPIRASALPTLVSAYCLANTAGLLALFSPGGIGVREGAFLVLLGNVLPLPNAALLTVAARIWQTLMDVLMAGAGLLAARSVRPADRP